MKTENNVFRVREITVNVLSFCTADTFYDQISSGLARLNVIT